MLNTSTYQTHTRRVTCILSLDRNAWCFFNCISTYIWLVESQQQVYKAWKLDHGFVFSISFLRCCRVCCSVSLGWWLINRVLRVRVLCISTSWKSRMERKVSRDREQMGKKRARVKNGQRAWRLLTGELFFSCLFASSSKQQQLGISHFCLTNLSPSKPTKEIKMARVSKETSWETRKERFDDRDRICRSQHERVTWTLWKNGGQNEIKNHDLSEMTVKVVRLVIRHKEEPCWIWIDEGFIERRRQI